MAGFGCCVDEGTFGGGGFGGGRSTSVGDGGESTCDPETVPSDSYVPFTQDKWPAWAAISGCSIIAILALNQSLYGGKGKKGKIFTPENFKKMKDCVAKKCKISMIPLSFGGRLVKPGGIPVRTDALNCFSECKKELMEGLGVTIAPSSVSWGGEISDTGDLSSMESMPPILCPPLCNKTEVVLFLKMVRTSWAYTNPPFQVLGPKDKITWHTAYAKVVSCIEGQEVCFDVKDFVPQIPFKGRLCVGKDGLFLPWSTYGQGPFGFIKGQGECGEHFARPPDAIIKDGKYNFNNGEWCTEMGSGESYVVAVYLEPAKETCAAGPK